MPDQRTPDIDRYGLSDEEYIADLKEIIHELEVDNDNLRDEINDLEREIEYLQSEIQDLERDAFGR